MTIDPEEAEFIKKIATPSLAFKDIGFAYRFLKQGIAPDHELGHILPWGMMPYFSLYLHEAYEAFKKVAPPLVGLVDLGDQANRIARSRHSIKFFDDTNEDLGGIEGVTGQFEEITETFRDYFSTVGSPDVDMGVFYYLDRPIVTTTTTTFYLGLPYEFIWDSEARDREIFLLRDTMVRRIALTGSTFGEPGPSFMESLNLAGLRGDNVNSRSFYESRFGLNLSIEYKAALVAFQCFMNFLALIVSTERNPDSVGPVLKLKLITLYHVLSSLKKMKNSLPRTPPTLNEILNHPTSRTMLTENNMRRLRNNLVHYIPQGPLEKLNPELPLCGWVDAYYPDLGFAGMAELLGEHTTFVADKLEEWSHTG